MLVYKLTDENARTFQGTQWGEGITHTTSGDGDLCGPGWLHYYSDPVLAAMLRTLHVSFTKPRLWEAEAGPVQKHDRGLKSGTTQLTTVREIPLPEVTTEQRVRFAIRCALEVYSVPAFAAWATGWLEGTDRSSKSAAAADTAYAAAYAADTAAAAAAYAAYAAADAKLPLAAFAQWAVSGEALPT